MNQILSVEPPQRDRDRNKKTRNSGAPIEISKIVRFFAISILMFGVLMIGSGSYSMYQESKSGKIATKPTIQETKVSDEAIKLEITHDKVLEKVTYKWNNEEPTEIATNGSKKVEQDIEIPTGENTLTVYAIDVNGQETSYPMTYTREGNITIDLEVEGNDIKIIAEGQEELSYMTYRWDEEEETKVEINDIAIEESVEIPKGQHTLTVIVVDKNNETAMKEQEVKGVTKPKLDVTTDGAANFVIHATDEEGIKRVEFIINETDKKALDLDKVLPLEQRKEFEYKYPLRDGENRLEIRVYNESDAVEVKKVKVMK